MIFIDKSKLNVASVMCNTQYLPNRTVKKILSRNLTDIIFVENRGRFIGYCNSWENNKYYIHNCVKTVGGGNTKEL